MSGLSTVRCDGGGGGGAPARNCLGQNFAVNEEKVILATLLQRFAFELVDPMQARPDPAIVLRVSPGLRVVARPRHHPASSSAMATAAPTTVELEQAEASTSAEPDVTAAAPAAARRSPMPTSEPAPLANVARAPSAVHDEPPLLAHGAPVSAELAAPTPSGTGPLAAIEVARSEAAAPAAVATAAAEPVFASGSTAAVPAPRSGRTESRTNGRAAADSEAAGLPPPTSAATRHAPPLALAQVSASGGADEPPSRAVGMLDILVVGLGMTALYAVGVGTRVFLRGGRH